MTTQSTITITGDRQTGKSYLLGLAAIDAALRGERVLYQCESQLMVKERLHDLEKLARATVDQSWKVYVGNGDERIEWPSGGRIYFSGRGSGRGMTIDLHILDGVDGEVHPLASRVMKAALA